MNKAVVAGVCICALGAVTADQAFGGAYLFEGGKYEQKFEGLTWQSGGTASDLGAATSGTVGWTSSIGSDLSNRSTYSFRASSTEKFSGTFSGAAQISPGASSLADKSITWIGSTNYCYFYLYLQNNTSSTFASAEIGYTLESWLKPGSTAPATLGKTFAHIGVFDYSNVRPSITLNASAQIDTFSFPTTANAGDTIARSVTRTGLDWAPGETMILTWYLPGSAFYSANQVIGLDDVFVTVPEPTSLLMASGVIVAALSLRQRGQAKVA